MVTMTENSLTVLRERYLLRDAEGNVVESPEGLFRRVAEAVAIPEKRNRLQWRDAFFEMMAGLRFLPNSPTLMNAGREHGQLSACFVLPIEDSLTSIFETLKATVLTHQSGGGTGFSFSRLRAKNRSVNNTCGGASGPIAFIRIFDVATEAIKQGGTRRGANMAILRVDHPDIEEFISCKRDLKSIVNFNISVGVTDDFMNAVESGKVFSLINPEDGTVARTLCARELFVQITTSAWECGDPGLVFLDRINRLNPTPRAGVMESTNPCGEQPLLPFESCNLGSLNLSKYLSKKEFDWEMYRRDIGTAVRFLDNVIDANFYTVPETRKITLRNRKIGLGVMGFADLMLMMGISYESSLAVQWGERLMSFLDREAKLASARLASVRGAFPNWKGSLWERLGYAPLRNATVSTVAPTGTISMIAGSSGGVEPIYAGVFARNVLSGQRLVEVHPAVAVALAAQRKGIGTISDSRLEEALGVAWSPAHRVSIDQHIRVQAAFQRHSDSAVSKTVNLPFSARVEDVERAYRFAYLAGCKGITIYRDRSRSSQVLENISCVEC